MQEQNDALVSVSVLFLVSMLVFSLGASILWIEDIDEKQDDYLEDMITAQTAKISEFNESRDTSDFSGEVN